METSSLFRAGSADELRALGRKVVQTGRGPVLILWHEGAFYALDNRCPHMGFPLHQGDVRDGLLDCHWHHARFDITCGATLDPWADDVESYPVVVKDGEVFLDLSRPPRDPRRHGLLRLRRGLEDNLRLVLAKATLTLTDARVDLGQPLSRVAFFGARERADGWQPGLSILAAMANVLPDLKEQDRPRALVHAFAQVASDCAGRPPRRPLPALQGCRRDIAGLIAWFRETVEVRDEEGAERILATLVLDHGPKVALHAIFSACTDHRYSDVGHTLDYAVKCAELIEHIETGTIPEQLSLVITSLVPQLTKMQRMEETSAWRRPVDVAALVERASKEVFARPFPEKGRELTGAEESALVELLLGEDPEETLRAILGHLSGGVSPVSLAEAVVYAATRRVLHFGTANETSDWDTVHHTLTYANAVAEGMRRAPSPELFRAVLDGAMSVYLDRFLNIPPARLPRKEALSEEKRSTEALLEELVRLYDGRSQVNEATSLAFAFLERGGRPKDLFKALGTVVLREDAGFHSFQQLELTWRRLMRRGESEVAGWSLVALARWLAAQFPTRRAREQTFQIARRLTNGESLFEA